MNKDPTIQRKEVWIAAWCATASASNCVTQDSAARWADRCLEDFDKRFPVSEFERGETG